MSISNSVFLDRFESESLIKKFSIYAVCPFFLIVMTLELLSGIELSRQKMLAGAIVSRSFFLGQIHICLTFISFLIIPEYRSWLHSHAAKGFKLYLISLFIFVSTFSLFAFCQTDRLPLMLGLFVHEAWTLKHVIGQTKGLSIIHDGLESSVPGERRFFSILTLFSCASVATFHFFALDILSLDVYVLLRNFFIVAMVVLILSGFLKLMFFEKHHVSKSKKFYLMRLFFLPFLAISDVALWGLMAGHGLEYLYIFQKSKKKSAYSGKISFGKRTLCYLTLALVTVGTFSFQDKGIVGFYFEPGAALPIGIGIMIALTFAFSWTHFYLDARLFRLGKENSKKHILPLVS